MLRIFAGWWAKKKYIFNQEVEAETNLLNAGLSLRLSTDKRALIEKLNKEADEMDARIKEVSELEEKGFWLCENGHEFEGSENVMILPAGIPSEAQRRRRTSRACLRKSTPRGTSCFRIFLLSRSPKR